MPGTGHLPAVVPGSFGAWMLLLRDYGTMTLREVLEPAITIALDGFVVKPEVANLIKRVAGFFRTHWPSSAAVFLKGGNAPKAGELLHLPGHAETYLRIILEAETAGNDRVSQIERATHAWYQGFVAEAVDRFFRTPVMDTTGATHTGFLTGDDLAGWKASLENPVNINYGEEYCVFKPGPWAQSPVFLQQLALLQEFDIAAMDPLGAQFVHVVQECAKLAFSDRDKFYGDPRFAEVPLRVLLSEDYNRRRCKLVDSRASQDLRPGFIDGRGGDISVRARGSTVIAHAETTDAALDDTIPSRSWAEFLSATQGDTCHLDIIDRWGNMISGTPSGGWLSGSPVVPGLGFCISVRGQMFSLDESHPNSLVSGKRPRTTLTPTLAFRRSEPYMSFGTPGGDQQDQWALHAFLRHVQHGMTLQEALDAPSFHTDHLQNSFYPREWVQGHLAIEEGFPVATLAELDRRGHRLEISPKWGHGNSVTMVARDGRLLRAAASPRRMQCYAIGR
jgi:gamma-glutamyltranspeptidase/glutathione hydrolase